MNAAGRRAEIIRIMRVRKKDTIDNLAHELGVSRSTIKRDLLTLTVDEGYHIDTLQGNGGGVVFNEPTNPYKGIFSQKQKDVLSKLAKRASQHDATIVNDMIAVFG
ncbi:MAG: HTH domain-containing protein [Defluviitaleaceae bacterium]|nr:HTH domain-containing protein [Defluviitaleaceae bacterium]MCL2261941.1 HTH domain-containing protein [Defluviitaleaceae bacterium]